ncbi:cytochrome c1 [Aliikangiella sp. IMCC44653]
MKKLIMIVTACLSLSLTAAEQGLVLPNDKLPKLTGDMLKISMQRGLQVYVNNCLGCHGLEFQRYNRTAKDLGIPEEIMMENVVPKGSKIGDLMTNNMSPDAAANWFGTTPPDLSLIGRSRGSDWLYNYLRAFYKDESRPYGVNNTVFKDVGMPHALESMQGIQAKSEKVVALEGKIADATAAIAAARKKAEEGDAEGTEAIIDAAEETMHAAEAELIALSKAGEFFTIVKDGQLTPAEFDQSMADLVNFLDYVGEPIKLERRRLGVWVLLFILGFGFIAYLLKKEYWKDIH